MEKCMPKTYTLQGPIMLENLNNMDALAFAGAVINAIPSYSMGTASINIQAQGPSGTSSRTVSGTSVDALKKELQKSQTAATPTGPEDIIYNVRGRVNLVGLSLEDGIGVIEAAMNAIPGDSLVVTGMVAQQENS
jgi:hypothetical protein